ncbi:hypothetical protein TNCV_4177871 [Trichonephila clavipes]|nr:hypothetical protein TNCV_4177871 [Trichonephila clavipes]
MVAAWNQVVFSYESRFGFSRDDNRVRVWRLRDKCFNSAFTLQRRTTNTVGVKSHVFPSIARLPGASFRQAKSNVISNVIRLSPLRYSPSLPPFTGLLYPQTCHQFSLFKIILDSKLTTS